MLCFQKDRFSAWSGLIGLSLLVLFLGQSTARALSPLQTWHQQFFGTTNNTGIAADDADPDGDGLANLLEYATGLDPTSASPDPIVFDTATGSLRVTLPKNTNAINAAIAVEITTNLSDPLSWTTSGTIIDQNTSSSLVVRDAMPIGALDARFMRVKFTDLGLVEPGIPRNFTTSPGAASGLQ